MSPAPISPSRQALVDKIAMGIATYVLIPYLLLLALLLPWRRSKRAHALAEFLVGPLGLLEPLWAVAPLVIPLYLYFGSAVAWTVGIVGYVLVLFVLHSMIVHGSEYYLRKWANAS